MVLQSLLRRSRAVANLGFVQLRQVVYDKYDPHYRWRKKLAAPPLQFSQSEPVVLLPTAYSNVTKTALKLCRDSAPAEVPFGCCSRVRCGIVASGECPVDAAGGFRNQDVRLE